MFVCTVMLPVLDFWRWLKAAGDALDGMLRSGVILNGALELSGQWDRVMEIGAIGLATRDDFESVVGDGLGRSRVMCCDIQRLLTSSSIGMSWILEDQLVHSYKWLRPDTVPPILLVAGALRIWMLSVSGQLLVARIA